LKKTKLRKEKRKKNPEKKIKKNIYIEQMNEEEG
jgi:hypothetical protein